MADTTAKKKQKSKPPVASARTLALAAVFLGLIAFVGYRYLGSVAEEELPEPEVILDSEGKPVPPPPIVEPDPATMPPGNLEEVRPS